MSKIYGQPLYWRETHKQPRFLMFDGRVVSVMILCVMHIRVWTILALVISLLVLLYFGNKGISADSIIRFLRAQFVGKRRTARGLDAERGLVDFGFETAADVRRRIEIDNIRVKQLLDLRRKTSASRQAGAKKSMLKKLKFW